MRISGVPQQGTNPNFNAQPIPKEIVRNFKSQLLEKNVKTVDIYCHRSPDEDTVNAMKEAGFEAETEKALLSETSKRLTRMKEALDELIRVEKEARKITDEKEKAFYYKDSVKPVMDDLRLPADELEMMVDKELWPLPTYGELMFEV